jgi:hypothetical protein
VTVHTLQSFDPCWAIYISVMCALLLSVLEMGFFQLICYTQWSYSQMAAAFSPDRVKKRSLLWFHHSPLANRLVST